MEKKLCPYEATQSKLVSFFFFFLLSRRQPFVYAHEVAILILVVI